MVRKIDRYILREVLVPSLLGLLLFTFVLLMNTFFLIAREVIEKDVSFGLVMRMIGLELPRLFRWTLPMAVLLGSLIGVGRMSAQSEIVALRAAGLSFGRIGRGVLILGLGASLLGIGVTFLVVPPAIYASRSLRDDIVRSRDVARELKPRVFFDDLPGVVLYADEIVRDGEERILQDVLLHVDSIEQLGPSTRTGPVPDRPPGETDESTRRLLILARQGWVDNDRETGEIELTLEGVRQYLYQPSHPEEIQEIPTDSVYHRFPPPPAFAAFTGPVRRDVEDQSLGELLATRREVENRLAARGDSEGRRFRVRRIDFEIHGRMAIPLASLVFAVLGFALASVTRRGGRASGFALSLALIILYWILYSLSEDLGREGHLSPALAAWGTNILLGLMALVLLWFRRTRGDQSLLPSLGDLLAAWGRRRRPEPERPPPRRPGLRQAARMAEEAGEVLAPPPQRGWGPPLIDRYLVGHFLRVVLYTTIFLVALYLIVEFTGLLENLLNDAVPWLLVLEYFVYFVPSVLRFAVPVACLCAALVTIALLSRHGEVVAMKAGGLSIGRISRPLLSTTILACIFFFFAQEYFLPVTNRQATRLHDRITGRSILRDEATGRSWVFGSEARLYGYLDFLPGADRLSEVSVLQLSSSRHRLVRWIEAREARVAPGQWVFHEGWDREFTREGVQFRPFEELGVDLPVDPELFGRRERFLTGSSRLPEQMNIVDLWTHTRDLQRSGYDVTGLLVSLYEKIAYPLTPLVMVLLGLPFAFRIGRRGSLYGIGVALGMVIAYWAVFAFFQSLGREGLLSPLLAAGAPNGLFALAGAYLFLTLRS
jgi:LPS export ABC transporter permease LptG